MDEKCYKKERLNTFTLQIIDLLLLYYVFKAVSHVLKNQIQNKTIVE